MTQRATSPHLPWPERLVEEIQLLSLEHAIDVYLVGGIVRDALLCSQLSEQKLDLDFVVVGDGIRFARSVAERINCKIETFKSFGTARLSKLDTQWFDENTNICDLDIVTARSETYKSPGAFPSVTPSTLDDDLQRRDFTINTLCLPLSRAVRADWRSSVIDTFNGVRDLDLKRIHVLHERSFIDDPTRIFRAARYAARYGFRVSEESLILIQGAITDCCFETISTNRVAKEYSLIEKEETKAQAMLLLQDWGVDLKQRE